MQKRASLALDVDGTLTTASPSVLTELKGILEEEGVPVYINTARDERYCVDPSPLTTSFCGKESHFCRPLGGDPVTHKVSNMERMKSKTGVEDASCCILVDDREENVNAVQERGFTGILVEEREGITASTVEEIRHALSKCRSSFQKRLS